MQSLRNIGIVCRITLLECARRQVFLVLVLMALALIAASVAAASFDHHAHRKMLADLCLSVIFVFGSVLSITISSSLLPSEIEHHTIYPVIAKPVLRWQFLLGKYAGGMTAVAAGMALMAAGFALVERVYVGGVDVAGGWVILFLFLEAAILGAISLWLSTFLSWPMTWFLSLIFCLLGNVKLSLYSSLMALPQSGWNRVTISALYQMLPDLAAFDFKDAAVHSLIVPTGTLAQAAAYALCYIWAVLFFTMYSFARREL